MRIGIEIGWSHKPGGARRVASNLIREMHRLRPDYEYHVALNEATPALAMPGVRQHVLSAPVGIPRTLWDQFLFPHVSVPRTFDRLGVDVALYTNSMVPVVPGPPGVVMIYDVTPYVIPEHFGRFHGAYQRLYQGWAGRRYRHIVTTSEHSKRDIVRELGTPPERIRVVPLAADLPKIEGPPEAIIAQIVSPDAPFVLYAGAVHPRKNLARLVKAFIDTASAWPDLRLLVAGQQRWGKHPLIPRECPADIVSRIHFLGRVTDAQLVALYRRCSVFVYPSVYEGFGLPVLEAMSEGAPVITSRGTSLEEVGGDAAILVDPYDEHAIASALDQVLSDAHLAASLRQRGRERAALYSWGRAAESVLEELFAAFHEAGGGRGPWR